MRTVDRMARWWDWLTGRGAFAAQPVRQMQPMPRPIGTGIQAAATNITALQQDDPSVRPAGSLPWQNEVWDFYDELGEFRYGITWKAEMSSRVRLRAGKIEADSDEPVIVETGIGVDLINDLAAGIGGKSEIMSTLSTFLSVPGDGYLIGEAKADAAQTWRTYSLDEVQYQSGIWKVLRDDMPNKWRELPRENLVIRIYRPHKRYRYLADSPARAARKTMREVELVNRHIQAQYLSRLASAGIVIIPEEVTFPVREEFQDAPDGFVREWVAIAKEAIATPGTAAAIVPIPVRIPAEYAEAFKHLDFTLKIDEKIIEKRESAIKRLATQLDLPAEILLGMGDINHWGAWQIEESAVKAHISPDVELMCYALTTGYLHPMLKASGMSPAEAEEWVVWYDASEITLRPDRSESAVKAYDRYEISGRALRREIGFDEDDMPNPQELEEQVLKSLAKDPRVGFHALNKLTGLEIPEGAQKPIEGGDGEEPADEDSPVHGPPDAPEDPGAAPEAQAAEANQTRIRQGTLMHHVRFSADGKFELLHPADCQRYLFSCPVTYATRHGFTARPGKSGTYECYLAQDGVPTLGQPKPNLDAGALIASNGHGARPRS